MKIKNISPTCQEFEGVKYWQCNDRYFQSNAGVFLHRTVWEFSNDAGIPEGYVVHHIDEDRTNNILENLEIMTRSEHTRLHHGSDQGREWHKEHYKNVSKAYFSREATFTCARCGKEFVSRIRRGNRFCSQACRANFRYHSGTDNETRTCAVCNKNFATNHYSKAKCCSRECGIIMRSRLKHRVEAA